MIAHASSAGPRLIALAAGGTGGHLFPAQALGEELKRRGWRLALLTDTRAQRFDSLFPGAEVVQVPSATISPRRPLKALGGAWKILRGLMLSRKALKRLSPELVLGFGGYPTLPPLLAGLTLGLRVVLHEQNAVLGRVNRLLGEKATAIASTFARPKYLSDAAARHLVVTGNPVRRAVLEKAGTPYEPPKEEAAFHLLVFGGSQGARIMSDIVPVAIAALADDLRRRLRVVQQCREEDIERVRHVYDGAEVTAELSAFFDDMPARIAANHLVIARAGASTVSELSVIGRPSILVPLAHSLDDDQKANAEMLAESGAAWMIEETEFKAERLSAVLADLLHAPERLEQAARAALAEGRPDAVERLADLVERLVAGENAAGVRTGEAAHEA